MASIRKEILIGADPEAVWAAVRNVGEAHHLFVGVLSDARLDGDARIVTFANGTVVRELIVDVDDRVRRFAYASVGGRVSHHNATIQVFGDEGGGSRVVWMTDFLPDELRDAIGTLVEQGSEAMRWTLERGGGRDYGTLQP